MLKSATAFHDQGDYAHSIPILRELVSRFPGDYDANLMLGQDLLRNGDIEAALGPLRAAAEIRSTDDVALTLLANAAVDLGDFSAASQALQEAVARQPDFVPSLVNWADFSLDRSRDLGISMRKTRPGEAVMLRVTAASRTERNEVRARLLAESAAKYPEQPGIWGELGSVQLALGEHADAAESLKQALGREPERTETLELEALFAAYQQRWPEAAARLSAIAGRSPADLKNTLEAWPPYLVPGHDVKGRVWDCLRNKNLSCVPSSPKPQSSASLNARDLYAGGRWEELAALPAGKRTEAPRSLWRGVALARTGDCPRAIPWLELGLSADELTAGYWLQVCYARAGQTVMAHLARLGDEVAIHELKGDLLLRLRNDGAAAEWEYAAALKLHPNDPQLLARLADASDRIGNAAQARESALAAVAADPHQVLALRILARMAMSERNYDEAIERMKALIASGSADGWTRVQLGVAYLQSGHAEEALHYLEPELRAGYPDEKGALHAQLARALRKVGRDEDAARATAEAAKLSESSMKSDGSDHTDVH